MFVVFVKVRVMRSLRHQLLSLMMVGGLFSLVACGGSPTPPTTGENANTTNAIADSRLETVKKRGKLICGINGEVPGFSFVDEQGQYSGLDVDICRAIVPIAPNLLPAVLSFPTKIIMSFWI
jgi:general L-amino acid transport system substrate-binding protein